MVQIWCECSNRECPFCPFYKQGSFIAQKACVHWDNRRIFLVQGRDKRDNVFLCVLHIKPAVTGKERILDFSILHKQFIHVEILLYVERITTEIKDEVPVHAIKPCRGSTASDSLSL
jgi:hypothetical protein